MTAFTIQPFSPQYYDDVLALNASLVHFLSPMNLAQCQHLAAISRYFYVVEHDGKAIACLLALTHGQDYDSVNYQWFMSHYDDFIYIDRVIIDANYHRCGLGRKLYDTLFTQVKADGFHRITAEIDTVPYNATSLAFHRAFGFEEVDTQWICDGTKQVSLQVCTL